MQYSGSNIFLEKDMGDKDKSKYTKKKLSDFFKEKNISHEEQVIIIKELMAINIHNMICEETFDQTVETIRDMQTDPRLEKMNALVMLSLKRKGRGENGFTPLSQERFGQLVQIAMDAGIRYGFDSCGSAKFIKYLNDSNNPKKDEIIQVVEPCESGLFSSYINVEAKYSPCSFCEGTCGWEEGIDVVAAKSFQEIWNSTQVAEWKKRLLENNRDCPIYQV